MESVPKPWSVAVFETKRKHLTDFVRARLLPLLEEKCKRIVLRAPVKSGKREIAEYIAQRDAVASPKRVHGFISAWHRKADSEQRDELGAHNIKVFSIITKKAVEECVVWILAQVAKGLQVVLHLDECDHGSGQKQLLAKVWQAIRSNSQVTTILYSATPEEVLFSGEVEEEEFRDMVVEMLEDGYHINYTPPEGYCGPATFLDAGLVHEAEPFFHMDATGAASLSSQGNTIVHDLKESLVSNPRRNMIVLRLSYSSLHGDRKDKKKNKAIYQFLEKLSSFPELAGFLFYVDKSDDIGIKHPSLNIEKIQWSSPSYWLGRAHTIPIIIIIDQTSSRSTEWACHDRIFATHDFRNVLQYSTTSQAQERSNHYEQRYGSFQPIRVYGHTKTFLLSAGRIDYEAFLHYEWEKKKVDSRTSGDKELYRVRKTTAPHHELHPSCPATGFLEADADRLLQKLGCYADISLSARVAGRIIDKRMYEADWQAVTKDTWLAFWTSYNKDSGYKPKNPFIAAEPHKLPDGRWQGFHREWKLLEFDSDIVGDEGWGATDGARICVCYKNNVLGVAIVRCIGMEKMNSLRAFKSMYGKP